MQLNLCLKQKSFHMKRLVYEVKIKGTFCGKHLFFSLPFVEKFTGEEEHSYSMQVSAERVY